MSSLLMPLHQVIDVPLETLPTATAWAKLSPYWPSPGDQQRAAKVALFQYLVKAWGAISDDSYRALCSDLRLFFEWCRARDLVTLPASPDTLAAFLEDQAAIKRQTTVRRYLASISKAHQQAQVTNPAHHQNVKLAFQRLYRDHTAEPQQAEGLRWEHIDRALDGLDDALLHVRDRALALVAYEVLARPSEIQRLTLEGLTEGELGYKLRVIRSKKSKKGRIQYKFVSRTTAVALQTWCQRAGIENGVIFRGVSKAGTVLDSPLSTLGVTRAMQRLARYAGKDPQGFSGHSARIGACQDMAIAGMDIVRIMLAGDWDSPQMPAYYARKIATDKSGMAELARQQGR